MLGDDVPVPFGVLRVGAITIIHGGGADLLILTTDKPDGCWPYNGPATVNMHVAANSGEVYCEDNFPGVFISRIVQRA